MESGLDFTHNILLWGKHSHESETVIMAPSTVQCIRHVYGCNYNKIPEDGSHAQLHHTETHARSGKHERIVLFNGIGRNTFITKITLKTKQTSRVPTKNGKFALPFLSYLMIWGQRVVHRFLYLN